MEDRDNSLGLVPFPRFLDKPRLIGVFEMDEFILFFAIIVSIIGGSFAFPSLGSGSVMFTAFAAGGFAAWGYKKFKRNRPDGYTFQKLYRSGLIAPDDMKQHRIKYPYLSRLRMIPYGFTKEFLN
jgi:hypothetical protein